MGPVCKIVVLVDQPLTARDRERFGLTTLRSNGFGVEAWDCSAVLSPSSRHPRDGSAQGSDGERRFTDARSLEAALSALDERAFVIAIIAFGRRSWKVFRALRRHRLRYGMLQANALPSDEDSLARRLKRRAKSRAFEILCGVGWFSPADLVFIGGRRSHRLVPPVTRETVPVEAHQLDYDLYLSSRSSKETSGAGYAVFLDEYAPFHPDYAELGVEPFASEARYFPSLRRFFDALEKRLGTRIVVAAHPHARYEKHPGAFGSREIVTGRTAPLVKDASFVILHASTAVNFAVLFKKPLLFVTTRELDASPEGPLIASMAAQLGCVPIDVDRDDAHLSGAPQMDEESFERYRSDYIKVRGSQDAPFWQVVADRLKREVPWTP